MATNIELETLAGKALLESTFLARLLSDPAGAASSVGVKLTDDQVKYIKGLDPKAMQKLADEAKAVMRGTAIEMDWSG